MIKLIFRFKSQEQARQFHDETFWGYAFIGADHGHVSSNGKSIIIKTRYVNHIRMFVNMAMEYPDFYSYERKDADN